MTMYPKVFFMPIKDFDNFIIRHARLTLFGNLYIFEIGQRKDDPMSIPNAEAWPGDFVPGSKVLFRGVETKVACREQASAGAIEPNKVPVLTSGQLWIWADPKEVRRIH